MCGIAGRVGLKNSDPAILKSMIQALAHRGPDDTGFYFDEGVEFAMSRLAIIGVLNGKQPVENEDQTIQVICNGEIYNYRQLRMELIGRGHKFKTESDVEVIAHLFEDHDTEFVHKLRGMFAIAIWDKKTRRLVLVRDRLGKKPIVYRIRSGGGIEFASETKALLKSDVPKEPDFAAIDSALALGYPLAPLTGFKGIKSLRPAHMLVWQGGTYQESRYWSLNDIKPEQWSFEESVKRVEGELETATKLRLISERPIGALLSGGIDSSLVTAMMAKISPSPVETFSVGFSESKFDESSHARKVAAHLKTNHHEIIVKPDPNVIISHIANIADSPFADSSLIPTLIVSELAKQHVTVALSGDGGDEAFGGYLRYKILPIMEMVNPAFKFAGPIRTVMQKLSQATENRLLDRLANNLKYYRSSEERYFALMSWLQPQERESIWNARKYSISTDPSVETQFRNIWQSCSASDLSAKAMRVDSLSYLPGDLNYKVDMASMANSLEIRSPLMDQRIYEIAAQIPTKFHIHHGESKYLLKHILYKHVPKELVDRPKMGFGIPRAQWLRSELNLLMKDLLLGDRYRSRGWFDSKYTEELIEKHEGGFDTDRILWPLMMIELWAQTWLD